MRSRQWDRAAAVGSIRAHIWLYLSPASAAEDLALDASALLRLGEMDVLAVARVLFVLSDEVGEFLAAAPGLTRRLPTSAAEVEQRSTERIRGPVRWQSTLLARYASGTPNLYITAPTERIYSTPENELLAFMLNAVATLGEEIGWKSSTAPAGRLVEQRTAEAGRLASVRMLQGLGSRPIGRRDLARVRTGRHRRRFAPVLKAFERYQLLIEHLDRQAIRRIVEREGLVVQPNGVLFELVCLFEALAHLRASGWEMPSLKVFHGGLHVQAARGAALLDLWYQHLPRGLATGSRYAHTLEAHGLMHSASLRPDMVLRHQVVQDVRWLLIEAKMGEQRSAAGSTRAALADLLAYEAAFRTELDRQRGPIGLGIAWGSGLKPASGKHLLTTIDYLDAGLEAFLMAGAGGRN